MNRDELLAALTAERYDNRWWKSTPADVAVDDEVLAARRRRRMAEDYDLLNATEPEAK